MGEESAAGEKRLRGIVFAAVFIAGVSMTGCALNPFQAHPAEPSQIEDVYEHSTHNLARPPDSAAPCIVQNASGAGYVSTVQPLYGTRAIAVSVRTLLAGGETVATFSLRRSGTGAEATMTTPRVAERNRDALADTLLRGC